MDTYKSNLHQVDVFDGSAWIPAMCTNSAATILKGGPHDAHLPIHSPWFGSLRVASRHGIPTGLGSLDVFIPAGETRSLAATFRVYNDGGAAGTSGFNEDFVPANKVFTTGDTLVLICSPDPSKFRFNVGIRTLGNGASMTATLRSSSGAVVKTVTKTYPAIFFQQTTLDAFLGGATFVGNETLTLQMTAGEAIVYGATVDNLTNDSSMGFAQRE